MNFTNTNILIIGDVMLDQYWHGNTSRISPEAPVPVVNVTNYDKRAGGAANVAANIQALGGTAKLIGLIGDDDEGKTLNKLISDHNIENHLVTEQSISTISKLRILSRNQHLMRLDKEQNLSKHQNKEIIKKYEEILKQADVVIISDYQKGTIHDIKHLIDLANKHQVPVCIDPKSKDLSVYENSFLIK